MFLNCNCRVNFTTCTYKCVFCSTKHNFMYFTQAAPFEHCAMAQAFGLRPFTSATPVRFQDNSYEISFGRSGTGRGFPPSTAVFPCQYHSTNAPHTHTFVLIIVYQKDDWSKSQGVQNIMLFRKSNRAKQKSTFTFLATYRIRVRFYFLPGGKGCQSPVAFLLAARFGHQDAWCYRDTFESQRCTFWTKKLSLWYWEFCVTRNLGNFSCPQVHAICIWLQCEAVVDSNAVGVRLSLFFQV
jgi:hypothetical protein